MLWLVLGLLLLVTGLLGILAVYAVKSAMAEIMSGIESMEETYGRCGSW